MIDGEVINYTAKVAIPGEMIVRFEKKTKHLP